MLIRSCTPRSALTIAVAVFGHRLIPSGRVGVTVGGYSGETVAEIITRIVSETAVPLGTRAAG